MKFEVPVIEVVKFSTEDVITTSNGEWGSESDEE